MQSLEKSIFTNRTSHALLTLSTTADKISKLTENRIKRLRIDSFDSIGINDKWFFPHARNFDCFYKLNTNIQRSNYWKQQHFVFRIQKKKTHLLSLQDEVSSICDCDDIQRPVFRSPGNNVSIETQMNKWTDDCRTTQTVATWSEKIDIFTMNIRVFLSNTKTEVKIQKRKKKFTLYHYFPKWIIIYANFGNEN